MEVLILRQSIQIKVKKSENILDHIGSTELAAVLLRATQTEVKMIAEEFSKLNEQLKELEDLL